MSHVMSIAQLIIISFLFFKTCSLKWRYNLWTMKCTDLKHSLMGFDKYKHILIKIKTISTTLKSALVPLSIQYFISP